jgi:hypothetical protein
MQRHSHGAEGTTEGQTFFPPDFDDIEVVRTVMDQVTYLADPDLEDDDDALMFTAEVNGVRCTVPIRFTGGEWEVRTMWPSSGRGVVTYHNGKKHPLS